MLETCPSWTSGEDNGTFSTEIDVQVAIFRVWGVLDGETSGESNMPLYCSKPIRTDGRPVCHIRILQSEVLLWSRQGRAWTPPPGINPPPLTDKKGEERCA